MVEYQPEQPCCGVRPIFQLLDEAMRAHFASCEGGLPEAPLIDWAWEMVADHAGLFIDVGAHVGSWALPFASAGMGTWAFEPNPSIFPLLVRASAPLFPTLLVARRAVAETTGTMTLRTESADGGTGSIVRALGGPVWQVPALPLDDLHLAPSLIKIDVEGAELDVLRGARHTIAKHRPRLFFECWEDERGQRREGLFRFVRDDLDYETSKTSWPEMYLAVPR